MGTSSPRARSLARRLLFTLAVLLAYRVGMAWPVPGVDQTAFEAGVKQTDLSLLSALAFLGGGGDTIVPVFLLGVSPAIVASLAEQMGTRLLPSLATLSESPGGSERVHSLARRLAAGIAFAQAILVTLVLRSHHLIGDPSPLELASCVLGLTAGAIVLMWLGEQITERGLGKGLVVLILAGIVAGAAHRLPSYLSEPLNDQVLSGAILVASVAGVVYVTECIRRLPLYYPRPALNALTPPPRAHLPMPLNVSGMMPAIFAGALIGAPATLGGLLGVGSGGTLHSGTVSYAVAEAVLVILFTFTYAGIVFDPVARAEELRRSGAFIQGVRPGSDTVRFLSLLSSHLSLPAGVFLALLAAVPGVIGIVLPASRYLVSGTSLIIIVLALTQASAQARALRSLSVPQTLIGSASSR